MIKKFSFSFFLLCLCLDGFAYTESNLAREVPTILIDQKFYYQDWPVRRNTEVLLALNIFRKIFSVFDEKSDHEIVIRYPGGDRGNAWAIEFKEWLVSLGIPSQYIFLEPASGGVDYLAIILESNNSGISD